MSDLLAQLMRFGLTGGAATAVHFGVALLLIGQGIPPLWANGAAFVVAFSVSFLGHRFYTFPTCGLDMRVCMARFAGTALAAFALNEAVFAALLAHTPLPVWLALGVALAAAAVFTFTLGRRWAFADSV